MWASKTAQLNVILGIRLGPRELDALHTAATLRHAVAESQLVLLFLSCSILSGRHCQEAVSVTAGVPVLADYLAAGVDALHKGEDGVERRCARNVNRDGRRSVWEL